MGTPKLRTQKLKKGECAYGFLKKQGWSPTNQDIIVHLKQNRVFVAKAGDPHDCQQAAELFYPSFSQHEFAEARNAKRKLPDEIEQLEANIKVIKKSITEIKKPDTKIEKTIVKLEKAVFQTADVLIALKKVKSTWKPLLNNTSYGGKIDKAIANALAAHQKSLNQMEKAYKDFEKTHQGKLLEYAKTALSVTEKQIFMLKGEFGRTLEALKKMEAEISALGLKIG